MVVGLKPFMQLWGKISPNTINVKSNMQYLMFVVEAVVVVRVVDAVVMVVVVVVVEAVVMVVVVMEAVVMMVVSTLAEGIT